MHLSNDRVTEEYQLSRRQARRITAKTMDLFVQDFEEINIDRPQMVAKPLVNLEQGMQKDCSITNQVGLLHLRDK